MTHEQYIEIAQWLERQGFIVLDERGMFFSKNMPLRTGGKCPGNQEIKTLGIQVKLSYGESRRDGLCYRSHNDKTYISAKFTREVPSLELLDPNTGLLENSVESLDSVEKLQKALEETVDDVLTLLESAYSRLAEYKTMGM